MSEKLSPKEQKKIAYEKMIDHLSQAYGEHKREGRHVIFKNYTSKKIAEELSYDEGYFSKLINPPEGKEPSIDACQRAIKRVITIKENSLLKKWRVLAIALMGLVICMLSLHFTSPFQPTIPMVGNCLLTEEEQDAAWEFYSDLIQHQIALEILLIKLQPFTDKEDYIQRYCEELQNNIEETRKKFGRIHLRARNNDYLIDLIDSLSINNALENCLETKEYVKNDTISYEGFVNLIKAEVNRIQKSNLKRINAYIDKSLLENKLPQ